MENTNDLMKQTIEEVINIIEQRASENWEILNKVQNSESRTTGEKNTFCSKIMTVYQEDKNLINLIKETLL